MFVVKINASIYNLIKTYEVIQVYLSLRNVCLNIIFLPN